MLARQKKHKSFRFAQPHTVFGLLFVLLSIGVLSLSLLTADERQDIRQQAYTDVTTPTPLLPNTQTITLTYPQCDSNSDCNSQEVCDISSGFSVGNCRFYCQSDSQCVSGTVCRQGSCFAVPPTPLPTRVEEQPVYIVVTPLPTKKPIELPKPTEVPKAQIQSSQPEPTQGIKSTGMVAQIPLEMQTTKAPLTPLSSTLQVIPEKSSSSPVAALTALSDIPATTKKTQELATQIAQLAPASQPNSLTNKAVASIAQSVKGAIDTLSPSEASLGKEYLALTSTSLLTPNTYLPAETVIEKVGQAVVSSVAQVKEEQTKGSTEIQLLVQKSGSTLAYTLPIPKDAEGKLDQAALSVQIAQALNTPSQGKVINPLVLNAAQQVLEQGGKETVQATDIKKPFTNFLTCGLKLINCEPVESVSTNRVETDLAAINSADVVMKIGTDGKPLPAPNAHQIGIAFETNTIQIDQIASGSKVTKDVVAFQFTPVIDQVKYSLNATEAVPPKIISGITQTVPESSQALQVISQKTNVAQETTIVEALTVQTLLQELGISKAEVEYLDDQQQTKAVLTRSSDQSSMQTTVQTNLKELAAASEGEETLATQVQKYVQGNALYRSLSEAALPGIKQLSNQQSVTDLAVKIIHVDDLSTQSSSSLKAQTPQTDQVTALIVQDKFGNQLITFSGLEQKSELAYRAAELQKRILTDPNQFSQRVGEKLLEAAQSN